MTVQLKPKIVIGSSSSDHLKLTISHLLLIRNSTGLAREVASTSLSFASPKKAAKAEVTSGSSRRTFKGRVNKFLLHLCARESVDSRSFAARFQTRRRGCHGDPELASRTKSEKVKLSFDGVAILKSKEKRRKERITLVSASCAWLKENWLNLHGITRRTIAPKEANSRPSATSLPAQPIIGPGWASASLGMKWK